MLNFWVVGQIKDSYLVAFCNNTLNTLNFKCLLDMENAFR